MKCDREIVFSFLEEDNTQRAYFRLKPLLTVSGDVQEEAARLWPDNGALRIVPDKNEQGYFKDRMRVLGHFCIMDLTPFPPEANKIRTNKNYRPDREEKNQYILYSDTVKPIPAHTFYQVLEGHAADFAALAEQAVTTVFMIRDGDTLLGPVSKEKPEQPSPAPEMTAMVYDVACPDGITRTILCNPPVEETAPAPQPEPAKEEPAPAETVPEPEEPVEAPVHEPVPAPAPEQPLPIGKSLEILDQTKDFTQTLEALNQPVSTGANLLAQPEADVEHKTPPPVLNGTPLLKTAVKTSVIRPKNKVQEVVANQLRVAKNDPPAEPLPAGAKLRHIENPVERACLALNAAWELPESQQQLIDHILSMPGMAARLTPSAAGNTPLQRAMTAHLNDLEAERLSALVELDQAQGRLEAFKNNAINNARAEAQKKLTELEEKIQRCNKQLDEIRQQINALAAHRDALQDEVSMLQQEQLPKAIVDAMTRARMVQPVQGTPLYLRPRIGEDAPLDVLTDRLIKACADSGVACNRNAAIAVLTLLTVCRRIGIACPTPAAAITLMENIIGALGWRSGYAHQENTDQRPILEALCDDGTPAICLSTTDAFPIHKDVTSLCLARHMNAHVDRASFDCDPWPVLPLPALPFVAYMDPAMDGVPVSLTSLATGENDYDARALETLKPILDLLPPLSGKAAVEMKRFVTICARTMEGGLPAACDWAITLWLLSRVHGNAQLTDALRPLLAEYPIAAASL